MKWIIGILFCVNFLSIPEISEIRKLYPNASNSQTASLELNSKLSDVTYESNKTLVAYKGASIVLRAKFAKKIKDKINDLKEGAKYIEYAIVSEPNNIEIRLIRLSIQENVPKIANYYKNKKEDATFIIVHYKEQPISLKEYLKSFILQSKSFTEQEKKTLK